MPNSFNQTINNRCITCQIMPPMAISTLINTYWQDMWTLHMVPIFTSTFIINLIIIKFLHTIEPMEVMALPLQIQSTAGHNGQASLLSEDYLMILHAPVKLWPNMKPVKKVRMATQFYDGTVWALHLSPRLTRKVLVGHLNFPTLNPATVQCVTIVWKTPAMIVVAQVERQACHLKLMWNREDQASRITSPHRHSLVLRPIITLSVPIHPRLRT